MSEHDSHECDHGRQVRVADEWLCEDCMALMDPDSPDEIVIVVGIGELLDELERRSPDA